jgi:hypothetical protein
MCMLRHILAQALTWGKLLCCACLQGLWRQRCSSSKPDGRGSSSHSAGSSIRQEETQRKAQEAQEEQQAQAQEEQQEAQQKPQQRQEQHQ